MPPNHILLFESNNFKKCVYIWIISFFHWVISVSISRYKHTLYLYDLFAAISRIGIGINNPFLGKVTISEIPPEQLQSAISVMNFFRIPGTAIGTSIWVVFLEMRASRHSTNLINTQTADNSTSTDTLEKLQFLLGIEGIQELQSLQLSLYMIGELIYKEALTLAYQDGFILLLGVFIFAIIVSLSFGRR